MTTNKKYRKYTRILWLFFIGLLLFLILFFFGVSKGWFGKIPTFEELENPKSNLASEVYSSDGKLLGKYFVENRSNIPYSELSPHLIDALLATEDVRFRKHSGIDFRSLFRVFFGVVTGNNKGGGSTITQQLAKNLFPRDLHMSKIELVLRKFKEWVTAVKLEKKYSKNEIIAMYFNTVSFGSQTYGIKSAARTFFNKLPKDLNIEESALLVGIVNAPTRYSPILNPDLSVKRRNVVIRQMEHYDFIENSVTDSLVNIPIDLSNYSVMSHKTGIAKYFREYIRSKLKKWVNTHTKPDGTPYDLYKDGLKIYTTIDSRMQKYAEEAVKEHLSKDLQPAFDQHWKGHTYAPFVFPKDIIAEETEKTLKRGMKQSERYRKLRNQKLSEKEIEKIFKEKVKMKIFTWKGEKEVTMSPWDSIRHYKSMLQAGLISIDSRTGHVKAYVGGTNFKHFKYDHVTYGKRQVGSIFKPFLYALAMQEGGNSPCTEVANVQTRIELPNGKFWSPANSSDKRVGEMVTLKWALANSNNWISAYLIKKYSPRNVIKMARKMGVTSNIEPVPSIALGTPDISLYEMTGALNTFGNKGIYIEPIFITHIEDKNGIEIERFVPKQEEAMSKKTAYLMLEMLKGVVNEGTGRRLRGKYQFDNEMAGKTGTTQNQSDGWFVGLVPELTTGVWVGAEDRAAHFRSISLGQGSNMALPIWAIYMQKLYADTTLYISKNNFEKPLNINVKINCGDEDIDLENEDNVLPEYDDTKIDRDEF